MTFHRDSYDPLTLLFAAGPGRYSRWKPLLWDSATRGAARNGDDARIVSFSIPHWLAAVLLAILPARAARRYLGRWRRRRTHLRRGLCIACGYNLTCNTSGVCPECGTPVASNQRHPVYATSRVF